MKFCRKSDFIGLKPGVSRSVLLFVAPAVWTFVGFMLAYRGWSWLGYEIGYWPVGLALLIGALKSFFVLDRVVERAVARIALLSDKTCVGAVFSWKSWGLILLMAAGGVTLRVVVTPGRIVGLVYLAVGCALLVSSRLGWAAWFRRNSR